MDKIITYCAENIVLPQGKILRNGCIISKNGLIDAVGQNLEIPPQSEIFYFEDKYIIPTFINAHTHLQYSLMPYKKFNSFDQWLNYVILTDQNLTDEDYYQAAITGLRESIRSGATLFYDACKDPLPVIKAINDIDVRANVAIEVFSNNQTDVAKDFERIKNKIFDLQKNVNKGSSIGISPHAPYNMNFNLWKKLDDFAKKENLMIHTHLSESQAEVEFFKNGISDIDKVHNLVHWPKQYPSLMNISPVQALEAFGLLYHNLLATHLCYTDDHDREILAKRFVTVNHCPRSNLLLNNKPMDLMQFLQAGINVALGTDSLASNHNLSIIDELAAINCDLSDQQVLQILCETPASIFPQKEVTGKIEQGSECSFLVFDNIQQDSIKKTIIGNKYPRHVVDRDRFLVKDYTPCF